MKNQLLPSILLALLAIPNTGKGQMPFAVYDSIDIGNINAWISVHGQLWGDTSGNQPHCEFPKGSGKHIAARGGLWLEAMINKTNCGYLLKALKMHKQISGPV